MTEESNDELVALLKRLDVSAANERLSKRVGVVACPICKSDQWLTESASGGSTQQPGAGFILKDPRGYVGFTPSIPAITLSCSNCGFIRMHNIAVLNKSD